MCLENKEELGKIGKIYTVIKLQTNKVTTFYTWQWEIFCNDKNQGKNIVLRHEVSLKIPMNIIRCNIFIYYIPEQKICRGLTFLQ